MDNYVTSREPSVAVGDYLKTLWEVGGGGSSSTKEISEHLSVAPASVTNMLRRLQEMGFTEYERYYGATLTPQGEREALRLVRRHRLIETFLIRYLGYGWQEVHGEAERLEHAVSDDFTERLAELLGHPEHDPHGAPIPTSGGTVAPESLHPLSEAEAGQRVYIRQVMDDSNAEMLTYLQESGLVIGRELEVKEMRNLDGVAVVETEGGEIHSLGEPLARSILVQ